MLVLNKHIPEAIACETFKDNRSKLLCYNSSFFKMFINKVVTLRRTCKMNAVCACYTFSILKDFFLFDATSLSKELT